MTTTIACQSSLLSLPPELRLQIYETFLVDHVRVVRRQQPSNKHLQLLEVCSTTNREARGLLRRYVSLHRELQIRQFLERVSEGHANEIRWVDVANDARVVRLELDTAPVSWLYQALYRIPSIRQLRVFDCRQWFPVDFHGSGGQISIRFEEAMFPLASPRLVSYELHTSANIHIEAFRTVDPSGLVSLRLSGSCVLAQGTTFPNLRHLTLFGIKGNYFDLRALETAFSGCQLESFSYTQDRLGFEMRDHMLDGLVHSVGRSLRKLVLLGCSRITTRALADCLRATSLLRYLALSLVVVHELSHQFVFVLPDSLEVLKIQLANSWYTVSKINEERGVCDALELRLVHHLPQLKHLALSLQNTLLQEGGRRGRWLEVAKARHITLKFGAWEEDEEI
ncbi:hypothetical protein PUNSTDRAFT_129845 [Punctularia strigosozonata HHB-11173 SS5]|uniref:uncharacterized protein n=1 Tax=Punctularia strigosozonata (strain HHB-11173) TaxID=741275 RepID=UPI0004416C19|nr:uncharacterized protein PUNSTDRAFT_129845 [Punctularia strigosozonata HHB-11173 SS5]EIN14210.1 hypothetical protein PUNSTDRAFT_129845 [Punctularia strigosozonata HHB-11173 SS5]